MFLSIPNNTKNLKDKNTKYQLLKKRISCRLMVGASQGVEGYMILTRRVVTLIVTIVLCFDHVFFCTCCLHLCNILYP